MSYIFFTPVDMSGQEIQDVRAENIDPATITPDATQAARYVYWAGQLWYCDGVTWHPLGAATDEVFIGTTDPLATNPGAELWVDTTDPLNPVLLANVGGVWMPVGGGSEEVWVGPAAPDAVVYPDMELWYNPDETAIPPAIAMDDLTDADTTTTPPQDGDGLVWDAALGQWVPGDTTVGIGWGLETDPATGDIIVSTDDLDTVYARALGDLDDVDIVSYLPQGGDALIYDGTGLWVPGPGATNSKIDDLTDVDTSTTPPGDGQTLVWDASIGQWVPADAASAIIQAGPGITVGTAPGVTEIRVDTGEGIVVSANGVAVNADNTTLAVNATDQLELIAPIDALSDVDTTTTPPTAGSVLVWDEVAQQWVPGAMTSQGIIQEGPGIQVDTAGDLTVVAVDTGEGIVVGPNGIRVNTDDVTVQVNANDQLEVISTPVDYVAGPGMVVDDTQPPVVLFQVDTGEGIVITPNGVAANVDAVTIGINATDQIELIAPIDKLSDVDTTTVPPQDGDGLVWDAALGQWVPGESLDLQEGPGISIDTAGDLNVISVDTGEGIVVGPNGIMINTDNITTQVNANDQLEVISNFQAGPGIVVDSGTAAPTTIIQVDTGAAIIHTPDGIAVNPDNLTIQVNATDQIEIVPGTIPVLAAGPGIVVDDDTNPPVNTISVDPGAGIVHSPDGIAANVDAVTIGINATDQIELIAPIDALSDVDTTTVPPVDGDGLVWDAAAGQWVPGEPLVIQEGPGISIDTAGDLNVISVDTGAGIVHSPDGIMINADNTTLQVNVGDQLELIAPIDALSDVDTSTVPPAGGQTLVWDAVAGQWVPADSVSIVQGPGISISNTGSVYVVAADTAGGIVVHPDGLAVNVDNASLWINPAPSGDPLYDKLEVAPAGIKPVHLDAPIDALSDVDTTTAPPADGQSLVWDATLGQWVPGAAVDFVAGPGIVVDATGSPTTLIQVDTGAGIVHTPDGIAVNPDGVTTQINANDQLEVISTIQAGPGITVGTAAGVTEVRVDTGDGIIVGPNGVSVNADNTTLAVDVTTDLLGLIAPIDALSDVDTTTTAPITGDGLVWNGAMWIPGVPVSQGLIPLAPVRVATVGIIDTVAPPPSIDDVVLAVGDRVLVKDQPDPIQNGIFDYDTPMVRSADVDAEGELTVGNCVLVEEGTINGTVSFLVGLIASEMAWTPDADSNVWYPMSGKLDIEVGAGLVLTGKKLDVVGGVGIIANPDDVQIDRPLLDSWYGIVGAVEPAIWEVWYDTSIVEPV